MHKNPTPVRHLRMNQARLEEEEKREEERQEIQRLGGWWKERQPNKTKNLSEELKLGRAQVDKASAIKTMLAVAAIGCNAADSGKINDRQFYSHVCEHE